LDELAPRRAQRAIGRQHLVVDAARRAICTKQALCSDIETSLDRLHPVPACRTASALISTLLCPPSTLLLRRGRTTTEGARCKEGLVNRIAYSIQLNLKCVHEFVQSLIDNLADLRVVQLRAQSPQPLLGCRFEAPLFSPGDRQQRV